MQNLNNLSSDQERIWKELILSTIKIESILADLLKVEVQKVRKLLKTDFCIDEMDRTNTLLKNIFFLMVMIDERMKDGISMYKDTKK